MPPPFAPPLLWAWIRFTKPAVQRATEIVEREIFEYGLWDPHSTRAERRLREVRDRLVNDLLSRN